MKAIKTGTWVRARKTKGAYRLSRTRIKAPDGTPLYRMTRELDFISERTDKPYLQRLPRLWTLVELADQFRVLKNKPPRKTRQHSLKF